MKQKFNLFICCGIIVILILIGVKVYFMNTPLISTDIFKSELFDSKTKTGLVFGSVSKCAHKQKDLFLFIEAYRVKHGQVPDSLQTLINDDHGSMSFTGCPLGHQYIIHPENYGNPNGVFISESKNQHPTAFNLWIRGIKPGVQTMGDGIVHLFEGSKLITIQAKK